MYSTLQYALQQRFGSTGVDYRTMLHDDLTPGDVVAATIVAADVKSTPENIIAEAKSGNETIIDVANAHKMHAWPLEIFMGLVYLDYTDDPAKELRKADGTMAVDFEQAGFVGVTMAVAGDARALFPLVRKGIDVRNVHAHVRKPFRFLLGRRSVAGRRLARAAALGT